MRFATWPGKTPRIIRVGRGRYGPLRRRAPPPRADVAPIPAAPAPAANGGSHQRQVAPKPAPGIPADPGVPLRDELARELIERRLGIIEDDPVEAPRPAASMDLDTFFATISAMYGKHGLCPPFRLRDFASAWIASGIDPAHCLAVVDSHLKQHAASRSSGSADGLLPHLDKVIRFEWAQQTTSGRRVQKRRPQPGNALDEWNEYTARSKAGRINGDPDWQGNY
jgi:hypothetical protein